MEDKFSPQQSLVLIQSMIEKTKSRISENRFYFLLWGWVSFVGILTQFFLKVFIGYKHHYLVWLITVVPIIVTIIHSRWHGQKQGVRTYIGESMGNLWTGIGISFFVLIYLISNTEQGWLIGYPFIILFYGLGTFISGKILQFKPLVVGGIINWVLACAAIRVHFDYQMLFAAAAILTSYLIPGYLIKSGKNG
jgi:hypothetical protein